MFNTSSAPKLGDNCVAESEAPTKRGRKKSAKRANFDLARVRSADTGECNAMTHCVCTRRRSKILEAEVITWGAANYKALDAVFLTACVAFLCLARSRCAYNFHYHGSTWHLS